MNIEIKALKAFKDNYIWLLKNPSNRQAACIDPGDARPVLEIIKKEGLNLCAILITHHHWDHTGGISVLSKLKKMAIYCPKKSMIPECTHGVSEGENIILEKLGLKLTIMETPGHTLDHISYFNDNLLFSGDTLFAAGCGRIFEGSAEQMLCGLSRLAALPLKTKIYCAHEYTQSNLQFALQLEPHNSALIQRYAEVKSLRQQDMITLPSTIGIEKETNPFLRCHLDSIQKAASEHCNKIINDPLTTFSVIREWKNGFIAR